MRIKGVPFEEVAPGVAQLYKRSSSILGRVPTPLTAYAHCPELAETFSAFSVALTGSQRVEPRLKTMACVRAAQLAGCPF